jgi:hypothetical protein
MNEARNVASRAAGLLDRSRQHTPLLELWPGKWSPAPAARRQQHARAMFPARPCRVLDQRSVSRLYRPEPARLLMQILKDQEKVMLNNKRLAAATCRALIQAGGDAAEKNIAEKLERFADIRVKAAPRITRPTALFVDTVGASEKALEIAEQVMAVISARTDATLRVYGFDDRPLEVKAKGGSLGFAEQEGARGNSRSGVGIGASLRAIRLSRAIVEQIVIVHPISRGQNDDARPPFFVDEYDAYGRDTGILPYVVILEVGDSTRSHETPAEASLEESLETRLRAKGAVVSGFALAERSRLPNLLGLLGRPSKLELLVERLEPPVNWRSN